MSSKKENQACENHWQGSWLLEVTLAGVLTWDLAGKGHTNWLQPWCGHQEAAGSLRCPRTLDLQAWETESSEGQGCPQVQGEVLWV